MDLQWKFMGQGFCTCHFLLPPNEGSITRILTSEFPSHLNLIPSLVDFLYSPALHCFFEKSCLLFMLTILNVLFLNCVYSVILNLAVFPIFALLLFWICLYGLHYISQFWLLSVYWPCSYSCLILCTCLLLVTALSCCENYIRSVTRWEIILSSKINRWKKGLETYSSNNTQSRGINKWIIFNYILNSLENLAL